MRAQGYLRVGISEMPDKRFNFLLHIEVAGAQRGANTRRAEEAHHLLVGTSPVQRMESWGDHLVTHRTLAGILPLTLLMALPMREMTMSISPRSTLAR